jgi:branched-chain amino acid aminotransferase
VLFDPDTTNWCLCIYVAPMPQPTGSAITPNGTFLNGITRQRVIDLLRGDGATVVETTLKYSDFQGADEIFSSGNFAKVAPIIRIDDRDLQPGPFYRRARKLYWEFAHAA